jgi:peptidyl-prolyl cis-trans isomerase C
VKLAPIAAGLFVLGLLAAPAWSAPETVIAKVNGQDITEGELKFAESEFGSELAGVPAENRRRVLLDYLIETRLVADAAEKAKLGDTKDFEARMKYHRMRALRDAYIETQIQDAVKDKEARAVYDEKVKNLAPQEEVRAKHILVKTEDEAKKVAEELRAGKDFNEVAKKYSQGREGESGDLGYFARGQMVKPFEDAAFALEKGKISDPVQTEYGWHVLKIEDKRNRQPPSFDEVKDQITSSLINAKLQTTIQELRQNGKIDVIDPEIKKAMESDATPAGDPVVGEKPEEPKK